ncbi:hypothetical protein SAMD00019534_058410 [Acytostelium subglobosum LB1]|uniref:hypothetical protein n=1 Tax=Acytostelium subglobosum LB1 TaxID=1410327 RepID=UPI000644B5DB|nr:hypothetical protein SAMD00019534_058410 [Acytostelium subglobosum LB1]GAM22666.1 hypothetical protein SAMD00019534_058410 [Acytostelium subglobosum LB1]|eukprot:XP_012754786.1 hypothetical protein SAMD00019534_058410 [Acytostelium subglobosum LB1]
MSVKNSFLASRQSTTGTTEQSSDNDSTTTSTTSTTTTTSQPIPFTLDDGVVVASKPPQDGSLELLESLGSLSIKKSVKSSTKDNGDDEEQGDDDEYIAPTNRNITSQLLKEAAVAVKTELTQKQQQSVAEDDEEEEEIPVSTRRTIKRLVLDDEGESPCVAPQHNNNNNVVVEEEWEDKEEEKKEIKEVVPAESQPSTLNRLKRKKMPEKEVEPQDDIVSEEDDEEDDEEEDEDDEEEEDDDEDYESEEEEEEEDEEYVPKRQTKSTKKSTTKKSIPVVEEEEDDIQESGDEQNEEGEEEEEETKYEDQLNGFKKNLKTENYHSTTVLEDDVTLAQREFVVSKQSYEQLFWYQREGINWMWQLFTRGAGGILGDDMGLGKTMQVITFLKQLHHAKFVKYSLVVMPVSLIEHWVKEFERLPPKVTVRVYHGANVKERERSLEFVQKNGGILLTTYGMIVANTDQLKERSRRTFQWDYIILDEGHKIKETKTQISKKLRELRAHYKIIMTGTAIMNNLRELWALFDWVCDGTLLGSVRNFSSKFEKPILGAHISDSTQSQKKMGSAVAESLRKIIAPHFLRREKKDVFSTGDSALPATHAPGTGKENDENHSNIEANAKTSTSTTTPTKAAGQPLAKKRMSVKGIRTRKNDLICWLSLAQPQIDIYKVFLDSEEVKKALNQTESPLAALTVLKKISDHPLLVHDQMTTCNGADMQEILQKVGENTSIKSLVRNSCKMQFLYYMLPNLLKEGHRPLIFSQSTKMLDAIEKLLDNLKLSFTRIDGSISSTKERQRRIDEYNTDKSIFAFLLTIQVGALGLNLTSADRVIIFDPSWNTVDNQAVDRVYRIGQTKDVLVYRLITCGTIEEKIYRKQVFKGSLMKTMLNQSKGQHRYFTKGELRDLFTLNDTTVSDTQKHLEGLHSKNRKSSKELDDHLNNYLTKLPMLAGISDHDLLFSEQVSVDHDDEDIKSFEQGVQPNTDRHVKKKKITIVTKDTPNKSQVLAKQFIYADDDQADDDDVIVIEDFSSPPVRPAIVPNNSMAHGWGSLNAPVARPLATNQNQGLGGSWPTQLQSIHQPIQQPPSMTLAQQIHLQRQQQIQQQLLQQQQHQHKTSQYNVLMADAQRFMQIDQVKAINLLLDAQRLFNSKELEDLIVQQYSQLVNGNIQSNPVTSI